MTYTPARPDPKGASRPHQPVVGHPDPSDKKGMREAMGARRSGRRAGRRRPLGESAVRNAWPICSARKPPCSCRPAPCAMSRRRWFHCRPGDEIPGACPPPHIIAPRRAAPTRRSADSRSWRCRGADGQFHPRHVSARRFHPAHPLPAAADGGQRRAKPPISAAGTIWKKADLDEVVKNRQG